MAFDLGGIVRGCAWALGMEERTTQSVPVVVRSFSRRDRSLELRFQWVVALVHWNVIRPLFAPLCVKCLIAELHSHYEET